VNKLKKARRPEQTKMQTLRSKRWRRKWQAQGYTYKKVEGHWGWIKKEAWLKRKKPRARIHPDE